MQITRLLIAIVTASCVTFAQPTRDHRVKVLTVCEVLGSVNRNEGTAVAVVGRMERSVSLADHHGFLSQDPCEHPVTRHGHRWSNNIQIWTDWEDGMPKPPIDRPTLDQTAVAAKLMMIRKVTMLGAHEEPRFKPEGQSITYSHTATVPNEWAVFYGRIVKNPALDKDCGPAGCGGDDVPLVLIAQPDQIHKLTEAGTPSPEHE